MLVHWVRTRWSFMFNMISRAILLREAVDIFIALADRSSKVPNLRGRRYSDYSFSDGDWIQLGLICDVLKACLYPSSVLASLMQSHRSHFCMMLSTPSRVNIIILSFELFRFWSLWQHNGMRWRTHQNTSH
ncbi:hypothetical protein DL93DRAFT_1087363 [Clavulina sp. PMI_390]|nr:hypothetical protein DL93DRAFT_1087363 [Clavulina sp. PMI_390]